MADIYSHGTLGNVQSGKRIQPVSELQALQIETGSLAIQTKQAVKPSLLIGEKITGYKASSAVLGFGELAGSISIDTKPKYKILGEGAVGSKYPHPEDQVYFAPTDAGDIINKIYTGISTYGIGYTPPTADTSGKEIRRWPRNWYGDNIKS